MYETPSQEIYEDMKKVATEIWNTYDNEFWYVDEKLDKINSLENYADNVAIMYRMFDWHNQRLFIEKIKNPEVLEYLLNNK